MVAPRKHLESAVEKQTTQLTSENPYKVQELASSTTFGSRSKGVDTTIRTGGRFKYS